jgi:hypothetical protein
MGTNDKNRSKALEAMIVSRQDELNIDFEERDEQNPRTWSITKRLWVSIGPIFAAFAMYVIFERD